MTAELRNQPARWPVLLEPTKPRSGERAYHGWRRGLIYSRAEHMPVPSYMRDHSDDPMGGEIQWMIVRYVLGGESRATLAREFHVTDTTLQSYLSGKAWRAYTRPIIAALSRLGIGMGRGNRSHAGGRLGEIVRAQALVMQRALDRPNDERTQRLMRLLSAPWEAS